jgi:hypothetical protein
MNPLFSSIIFTVAIGPVLSSLSGRYCGSIDVFKMGQFSGVVSFHPERPLANFYFVFMDTSYVYDSGVEFMLEKDRLVLDEKNGEFNSFLATFPIGLTARSFSITLDRAHDTLRSVISLSMGMSFSIELARAPCAPSFASGVYANQDVSAIIDVDKRTAMFMADGEKAALIGTALMKELAFAPRSLGIKLDGDPVKHVRIEPVPGNSRQMILLIRDEARRGPWLSVLLTKAE